MRAAVVITASVFLLAAVPERAAAQTIWNRHVVHEGARTMTAVAADFTGDDELDFFDVSAFLQALSNERPEADFNMDGEYDFFDVSAYLQAFSKGCP